MSSFNPFAKKEEGNKSQVVAAPKKEEDKKPDAKKDDDDAKEAVAEPEKETHSTNICQMKRGDYMIHVMIEQAKNLLVDAEDTVDPIVEVKCMNARKFTTAQEAINNTGIAVWNEHIFFEPKNQEVEDLEKAKVEIKLMDKGYFKD